MEGHIKKWGNSAALRLPSVLLEAAALSLDQRVEIDVVDGVIMVKPVAENEDLDVLLRRLTPDVLHEPVDFGDPVGNELL